MALWSNVLNKALAGLPPSWTALPGRNHLRGHIELRSPAGDRTRFIVQVRAQFAPSDLQSVMKRLTPVERRGSAYPLLVASFLSPRSREMLREQGISHADETGNVWLSTPHIYVERSGRDRAPIRDEGGLRRSLRGSITGRVVRYLCEMPPPIGVRQLATHAKVNPGNVSRILDLLERDALVGRQQGAIVSVDWASLIRRWALDLAKDRAFEDIIAPRGIDYALAQLARLDVRYAVTGSYASAMLAPAVYPNTLDVYVEDENLVVPAIGLAETDMGNVRLIRPFDPIVFANGIERKRANLANPVQIAADLLSLPHRSVEEVDALFAWMERNERLWRRLR